MNQTYLTRHGRHGHLDSKYKFEFLMVLGVIFFWFYLFYLYKYIKE